MSHPRFSSFFRALPIVVAAAILSSSARAQWIVDANNGPGTNFTTINAAIAAAAPGDRILVRVGIYPETVIVNKGVTIVGWNATTYPMTVPADPFAFAVWGGLGVTNIPAGQSARISGLNIARPSSAGGISVGLINSTGSIVLDRVIVPNGGVFVDNCTDVILENVRVRHLQGAFPPQAGVTVVNSWVQANDLNATGSDLAGEPDFYPAAAPALSVFNNAVVALARPKLIGGFGGGPWITSASSPAGGAGIHCVGAIVSIVDDLGSSSYVVGGQGGFRGAGSALSIPSGSGGNGIQVEAAGYVVNKKPLNPIGGAPGINNGGGPGGSFGAASATATGGVYSPIVDVPSLYRSISSSVPGGFFIFQHHAAAPGYPVAVAIMPEVDLNLYPPSLQFAGGNPYTAIVLANGTADAIGYFTFGFSLPSTLAPFVGASVAIQTADDVVNTLFLSNPTMWTLGF